MFFISFINLCLDSTFGVNRLFLAEDKMLKSLSIMLRLMLISSSCFESCEVR